MPWELLLVVDVAAFMDSWLEQPGYPVSDGYSRKRYLETPQNNSLSESTEDKKLIWVLPLNSNWKGFARWSQKCWKFQHLAAQNQGALRSIFENNTTISRTIRVSCLSILDIARLG